MICAPTKPVCLAAFVIHLYTCNVACMLCAFTVCAGSFFSFVTVKTVFNFKIGIYKYTGPRDAILYSAATSR